MTRGSGVAIGVAVADMSDFESIDPAYGIGDQQRQVEALVDHELAVGGVPECGEPRLIFREFSSVDIGHKRAVADAFAADGVLAVLGARDFTYGSVRLAETHHVPVLDVNAVPRSVFARTDPWLFTIRCAQDLVYRTYAQWAHDTGRLDGRTIGVFSDRYTAVSTGIAIEYLSQKGHRVAVHVDSDGVGVGSDRDALAARTFADARVDLVMPFVSGSSLAGMLRVADRIGFRPTILDLETGEHATDVSGAAMPPSIYEGTSALVMTRVGELAAGRPLDAYADEAIGVVEAATQRELGRSGRDSSGTISNVLLVRDLARLSIEALRRAGPGVDRARFVESMHGFRDVASASGGRVSFGPDEHWGCREMREVVWTEGQWKVVGDYAPVWSGGG